MFKRLRSIVSTSASQVQADRMIDTIADKALQADVLTMLFYAGRVAGGEPCPDGRIQRVEVLEAPSFDSSGGWTGPWSERWTIYRCGETVPYVVDFTSDGAGGTNFKLRDSIVVGGADGGPPAESADTV
jgi:hypothetical protein